MIPQEKLLDGTPVCEPRTRGDDPSRPVLYLLSER